MPKFAHDDMMDAALNLVKNNANKLVICSSYPTTYTEANATYMLANQAMTSGDYALANGDTSGRKLTVAAKSGIVIANSGTATHVAVIDTVNSKIYLVTTCTSQALTANGTNTVGTPAWKDEIADAA